MSEPTPPRRSRHGIMQYHIDGKWRSIAQIARRLGRTASFVRYRLEAGIPLREPDRKPTFHLIDGHRMTVGDIHRHLEEAGIRVAYGTVSSRIAKVTADGHHAQAAVDYWRYAFSGQLRGPAKSFRAWSADLAASSTQPQPNTTKCPTK